MFQRDGLHRHGSTTSHLREWPANKIGPLSGVVICRTLGLGDLTWGYDESPRKPFPNGFLVPTTGYLTLLSVCHGSHDTACP